MAPDDDDNILLTMPSAEDPDPESRPPEDGPADTFAFFDADATGLNPPTRTVPSDPLLGREVGDGGELPTIPGYRLLRRINRGGMGEVHLAERVSDTGVTMRCAVKLVHPGHRGDHLFSQQILSEARIVADLRHPNIVSIFDVGRAGDHVWLAMEWIEGCDARSLRRHARERGATLPLRHVIYLVREALQGLHHAHVATDSTGQPLGIVHRDVSPGNVLLSRHGAVKLADFGVAAHTTGKSHLRLAGKPQYLAPELYRGASASVQSDLWAMGVTLYELLSMRSLFARDQSFAAIERAVLGFDPRALLADDLTLPDGLEPILLAALAPDPDQRYGSALEFLEDISDFAYEAGLRLLDAHFARFVERSLGGGTGQP